MHPQPADKLVQPYLFFNGRCQEALNFYRKAAGAEDLAVMLYEESPDKSMCTEFMLQKVMHASFRIGETTIMASDGRCQGEPKFEGFALSITSKTEDEARRLFAGLGEGGEVVMPLTPTFFAPLFGMVNDRFGVCWMILVAHQR